MRVVVPGPVPGSTVNAANPYGCSASRTPCHGVSSKTYTDGCLAPAVGGAVTAVTTFALPGAKKLHLTYAQRRMNAASCGRQISPPAGVPARYPSATIPESSKEPDADVHGGRRATVQQRAGGAAGAVPAGGRGRSGAGA